MTAPAAPQPPAGSTTALVAYLGRLEHVEKREYALAVTNALLCGEPAPPSPGKTWAADVERKVRKYQTPSKPPTPAPAPADRETKQMVYNRLLSAAGLPLAPLGPGSKEHKEVFEVLTKRFGLTGSGKQGLAKGLVEAAGLEWDADCYSAGDTIQQTGLERVARSVGILEDRQPVAFSRTADAKVLVPLRLEEIDAVSTLLKVLKSNGNTSPAAPHLWTALATLEQAFQY